MPFRDLISERLDRPVVVDNDANCALLAEARAGAAKGAADALLLTLGTGIGGGILARGELYRGGGRAGELGHMVVDLDGRAVSVRLARLPRDGRVRPALARAGEAAADDDPDSALGRARAEGREITGRARHRAGRRGRRRPRSRCSPRPGASWARGLASLANAFSPEVIVIGGGASAAGELLLAPAREELKQRALGPNRDVRVVAGAFRRRGGDARRRR